MSNFIPKPYGSQQISIRLANSLLEEVETAASQYNLNRNAFINRCIEFALAHMPKPEQEKDQP
ncbi:hypothetical protein [Agathobaculum sp.]|uniref:hypothetical protein n=1 Tax=Agathobaculum sp. TaxID=2048138 RepID=UPI002A802ECE|nr:hypothetical protein [Agathobaculum sp.]MDY3618273.1 hypothetical protein [Agathobaculum sp.]